AQHHAGDAMPRGGRERAVPADLRVVMGVRVDEPWRDHAVAGIDRRLRAAVDRADLDDLAFGDGDVGMAARRAGAVDEQAVADDEIKRHSKLLLSWACCRRLSPSAIRNADSQIAPRLLCGRRLAGRPDDAISRSDVCHPRDATKPRSPPVPSPHALPAADRGHKMHFAVWTDGREPGVLKDLAVDGDGIAAVQMRAEFRESLAEYAQELAHIARIDLHFLDAAGELTQRARENDLCHVKE